MNKAHVTIFALLVAAAAVLGAVAVTRTTGLGRAARHANDAAVATRTKQLEAYAAKLQQGARGKAARATSRSEASSPAAAPAQQRPPASSTTEPRLSSSRFHRHHGDDGSMSPTAEEVAAEMTSHQGRMYALALALVAFFLAWAVVAAHPWATATADPRLRALALRQTQLQRETKLVRKVVAARWATYRVELKARRAEIARVDAAAAAAASAAAAAAPAALQIVNLPAHVITRTS